MRHYALIVETAEGSLGELKKLVAGAGFECLAVSDLAYARARLVETCPHLIFVDLDAFDGEAAMDWVEAVKNGPFHSIPLSVFSRATTVGRIQRAAQARVTDYVLMPPHLPILTRKIADLCARARRGGVYQLRATPEKPQRAELELEADVTGVSETGLQIRGPMQVAGIHPEKFSTPLFSDIGVRDPGLRARNSGKTAASGEPINHFQIQGWSESDRKLLRHWIRARKLEALK
jgi:DNA-binding NtrC family response regulator